MNESVTLLLLQHLFRPEWVITRDEVGTWRATGPILISACDVDGLLEMLRIADPDALEYAARLLAER